MLTENIVVVCANVILLLNLNISGFRPRRPVLPVHQQHCLCPGHSRYLWGKWSQHVKVALSWVHVWPGYTFSEYRCVHGKHVSIVYVCLGLQPFTEGKCVRVTRIFRLRVCPYYSRFSSTRVCGWVICVSRAHVCVCGTRVSLIHVYPVYMRFPSIRVSVVRAFL